MSYTNITNASTVAAAYYVKKNWVYSDETTFLKKHVLGRGAHFMLAPTSFITNALDTIVGLGAGIGAICTLGKHQPTLTAAFNHLSRSNKLAVHPYVHFLKTINPEAKFSGDLENLPPTERIIAMTIGSSYRPARISGDGDGFISDTAITSLKNIARGCYNSDNFLKRHVASRLTYVLLAISCLVTRVVDGVIGVLTGAFSILTVGKFESLNNVAYRALQAPGIINDLFYCTIKFINPWTGTSKA